MSAFGPDSRRDVMSAIDPKRNSNLFAAIVSAAHHDDCVALFSGARPAWFRRKNCEYRPSYLFASAEYGGNHHSAIQKVRPDPIVCGSENEAARLMRAASSTK
jgi:hypothetical protein